MKILVPVKRVIDYNVKVRVKGDGVAFDLGTDGIKLYGVKFAELAGDILI